jgi:small GTP-binding protein
MAPAMVNPELQQRLAEARTLLGEIRDALVRFGATEPDMTTLAESIAQLDEFFLLVVVGEFNAGKSAFINALIGSPVQVEGVTPTTSDIHVLHGPSDLLRDVHIVDTPGTNAILREHERLTAEFVPRADLVLFVTSADRPFTESERAFLDTIRGWGKKIVLVVNKFDILEDDQQREQVLAFVRDAARTYLGAAPEIFGVSARLAMKAKQGEPALWERSGFEPLEQHVRATLEEESRFRLKMQNPLGVADALARRYATIARERMQLLAADVELLGAVESELATYEEDLARGFELRMAAIEKVLVEMEGRGHAYFEDTLRLGRVFDLLNRARVQKEFEERVVADAPRLIEKRVAELIDWMVEQDFRQWRAVTERLAARRERPATLGAPDVGTFHSTRTQLLESFGREAQRVVETYDRSREAAAIAEQARGAVTAAAAAGGAALGLGTLVTLAASTAAADVTGLLMASLVATLGFLIIPARRRRAKREMQEKITTLRQRLAGALRAEFEQAQARSLERLTATIAPLRRFVDAEGARWRDAQSTLGALAGRATAFRDRLAD